MAIATFVTTGGGCIDGKSPTASFPALYTCGISYLGASKDQQRRLLLGFDVFTPSVEGVVFNAGTVINAAELLQDIQTLMLPSFTEKLDRMTRADWDYVTATWNQYRSGSNWTAIGGDIDAAIPGELTYTSPGGFGDYAIPGLGPYVSDAIANRGGLVRLRMNHATENSGITQFHTCANTADGKPRLRVDYQSSSLIAVDDPRPQLRASARAATAASAEQPAAAAKAVRVMQPKRGRVR